MSFFPRYDLLACEIKHRYDHNFDISVNNSFQSNIIPKRMPYEFRQDLLASRTSENLETIDVISFDPESIFITCAEIFQKPRSKGSITVRRLG